MPLSERAEIAPVKAGRLPSPMHRSPPRRLLLFDVDGTLITSNGAPGRTLTRALGEAVGRPIRDERNVYLGSTDPQIVRDLLALNGVKVDDVEALTASVLARYAAELPGALQAPGAVRALPGVAALLDALSRDARFALGLVTGNVRAGADAKLAATGLARHFPVGAYGDDHALRAQLPPLALRRAEAHFGARFAPEHVWVIGDTPKDVGCARANGLRCLAVASGWIDAEALRAHAPDAVLDDFSDADAVVRALLDGDAP